MKRGLRESYSTIEKYLNSEETSEGRRNQVIYAIGVGSSHQLDTKKIGEIISHYFPTKAPKSNSGIGQVLSTLTKGDCPILQKIGNSDKFIVKDPRYIMCIRLMLVKTPNETVKKKGFKLN